MKIRIITSCTGEKQYSPEHQLTQDDFLLLREPERFALLEERLADYRLPAEEIYTGQQHVRLMDGVKRLREQQGAESVELWVLSAGYGLIPGDREIVPYECTFQGMKAAEIDSWAQHLRVPEDARQLFAKPADLVLVLLGDAYLRALDLDEDVTVAAPTVFFTGKASEKRVKGKGMARTVPLTNREAKRFSCGLVALKGEMAKRILHGLADNEGFLPQILDPKTEILRLLAQKPPVPAISKDGLPKKPKRRTRYRPNPAVDYVIEIPESWWNKPHREKLRYFIPEWDDLVDPDYDFETDTHSGGQGDWSNEVYAHQMYEEPNYDGILMSRAVAEKSKKKKKRINEMGVHRYLRLPSQFPIMGDCGAFDYIQEEVPPYTTEDVIDYYTRLGFNYGVSVDHLIVAATEEQRHFRYELTIHNAEEFLREHQKMGLPWTPIGSVQGWDPKSYAEAVREYIAMGYRYIALGGLVRTNTREILRILEAIRSVVPKTIQIHLFGVARLNGIGDFAELGVTSVDSAAFLRRAWMGTTKNYLALDGRMYTAIRIPEAGKSFRAKRMVSEGRASAERVEKLEAACLAAIRGFDKGEVTIESALDVVLEYDRLITTKERDIRDMLRATLEDAPWKSCPCEVCRKDGIEVVIFRGNNRNRRRGFHNTFAFYRLLQRELAGEVVKLEVAKYDEIQQLSLF